MAKIIKYFSILFFLSSLIIKAATPPTLIRKFDNALFNTWSESIPPFKCTLSVETEAGTQQIRIEWDRDPELNGPSDSIKTVSASHPGARDTIIINISSNNLSTAYAEAESVFYWSAQTYDGTSWSNWSDTCSFVMDCDLGDNPSFWYQFFGTQLENCTQDSVTVAGDSVILQAGKNTGFLTSPTVLYSDLELEGPSRDNWNGYMWTKSNKNDSIGVQVQFYLGGTWYDYNSLQFDNSTSTPSIDLSGLDTSTFGMLRLKAKICTKIGTTPALYMWKLGDRGSITSVPSNEEKIKDFNLLQNEPNPFTYMTEIKYQLPCNEYISISIYDMMGRKVKILLTGTKLPGSYKIRWDGKDDIGNFLPAGVYFLRMKAGNFQDTRKMLLVR